MDNPGEGMGTNGDTGEGSVSQVQSDASGLTGKDLRDAETHSQRWRWLICVFLILMCLTVFHQVAHFGFVSLDDPDYVAENAYVQAGLTEGGVIWAFTTSWHGHWHPLTWLSHMLDCQIFGVRPGAHHLVNLFFHVASVIVLFLVWNSMTGRIWASGFVAAAFALHPLRVESVAWIAERKDVLSTFFWMLTIAAYVRYARRPSRNRMNWVLLAFGLGLMAKSMLITLPFVFLLLDYWPLCRLRGKGAAYDDGPRCDLNRQVGAGNLSVLDLLKEKIPLFVLVGVSCIISIWASRAGGSAVALAELSFPERLANGIVAYFVYLGKMVWPSGLICIYPHRPGGIPLWQWSGSAAVLLAALIGMLSGARRRPWLLVGGLWYLGTLLPVLGLAQAGPQAYADRYTYVPLIGISVILAWGCGELAQRSLRRKILLAAGAVMVLAAWSITTFYQVRYWRSSNALFSHAVAVMPGNYLAHNHLGADLSRRGELDQATEHYRQVVKLKPDHWAAFTNLGDALLRQGKPREAMDCFRQGLAIRDNANDHVLIGEMLAESGKSSEAIGHFRQALELNSRLVLVHFLWGTVLARQDRFDEAIEHWSRALKVDPTATHARLKRIANFGKGHPEAARKLFEMGHEVMRRQNARRMTLEHIEKAMSLMATPRRNEFRTNGF